MLCGNFENEPPIYSTIEDCKKSLEKAVIDRCMADVEVGLFLSGGLGMISHKKSLITIFGHKHEIKNFIKKIDIFHKKNSTAFGFWFIFGIKWLE